MNGGSRDGTPALARTAGLEVIEHDVPGRAAQINCVALTSDCRVAEWGELKANWIYLKVGMAWGLG